MRVEEKKPRDEVIAAVLILIFAASAQFCLFGCKPKSDEEQIIDTLNKYFKAQGKGDYRASYRLLAPQVQQRVDVDLWVKTQSENINAVRLMRDPRLSNIVVKGDSATAIMNYMGIPPAVLTAAVSQIYSKNFNLPIEEIAKEAEEDLINNFDQLKEPQTMPLTFLRSPDGWRLYLDLRGDSYERKQDGSGAH